MNNSAIYEEYGRNLRNITEDEYELAIQLSSVCDPQFGKSSLDAIPLPIYVRLAKGILSTPQVKDTIVDILTREEYSENSLR